MALDVWKKFVSAPVAELLKKRGFRKKGANFYASHPGVTLKVGLQSSTISTRDSLKITCNLKIFFAEPLADPRGSTVSNADWEMRIGGFLGEPCDFWWPCSSDEAAQRAGREMAALLEERALPVMEQLASSSALAALWASGLSPGLTARGRIEKLTRLTAAGVKIS